MDYPFFINGLPSPTNQSKAIHWLLTAEKLLASHDLEGSKSFANGARELDPTLAPAADQILAIADILNAGSKRINDKHFDYYSILQIPPNQTQNADFIAQQYNRFDLLVNPQKNKFPFSDQAFRLVADAFAVLYDRGRKSMYDEAVGCFLNPYPVAASTPIPLHQCVYPSMSSLNADQIFVNLPTQNQGSHAAGVSFSRDPQAGISMPVTFLTHEQETVTSMASSHIEQQLQQPVTFLKQQTQPMTPISFLNTDEQSTTFLCLNQPQLVTSVRSLNRENPPFGIGVSSTQEQEPVVCAEQHENQQPPERNENVVGNNANKSASTGDNVKEKEGNVDANKSASTGDNVKEKEGNVDASGKRIPSFWTACPYCLFMYEYSVDYTHCTLRCQNCKKGFQAVPIASPPPIIDGEKNSFCCWGFMPFGLSLDDFNRNIDNGSSWSPFSPMFTSPRFGGIGGSNVNSHAVGGQSNVNNLGSSVNAGGSISGGGQKHFAPRTYVYDEDDVFVAVSESSEESDVDWNQNKERKKANNVKRKRARTEAPRKNAKKQHTDKAKTVEGNIDGNLQDGLATQGGVEMPML